MTTKKQMIENQEKPDFDLIKAVGDALTEIGLYKEVLVNYYAHPTISQGKDVPTNVQRILLNRYWNQQLITCEQNTIPQRTCLITDGTTSDWLRLFKNNILPVCLEYQLPKQL